MLTNHTEDYAYESDRLTNNCYKTVNEHNAPESLRVKNRHNTNPGELNFFETTHSNSRTELRLRP